MDEASGSWHRRPRLLAAGQAAQGDQGRHHQRTGRSAFAEEAQLVVGTVEGANPLQGLGAVNQECADLEIEQGPAAVTMSFQAVEGLDGTKMTMTLLDEAIEMLLVGRQDGDTVVALTATGLEEDQARRIVERQLEKLTDL